MKTKPIIVQTAEGGVPVDAYVFGNYAVHHPHYAVDSREWFVTHVPSGLKVPDGYLEDATKADAIRVAIALDAARPRLRPIRRDGKRSIKIIHKALYGTRAR